MNAVSRETPSCAGRRFQLVVAERERELQQAAQFRREVFWQRRGVAFDEQLEARRDRAGRVFLLFDEGGLVATGRLLPYPSLLSPLLTLTQRIEGVDSELGRIAAVRSSAGLRASLALLTLGASWVLRETELRRYAAYCHPKLIEMYRAIGAEHTGGSCAVPGRQDAHLIVSGSYADAARSGSQLEAGGR